MKNQSKEGRNPSASPLEKYFQHYNEKKLLPLHMPGHQRKSEMGEGLPYAYDYTEVEDMDNLHAPEGILQEVKKHLPLMRIAVETSQIIDSDRVRQDSSI